MPEFEFADRYAAGSLAPTAQMIAARQAPAERIVENATTAQIFDLVALYYGSPSLDLGWFKAEFIKEDVTFSLVNNEREARILAEAILAELVAGEQAVSILALVVGSVSGHRTPAQDNGLLREAEEALGAVAVAERTPKVFETKVAPTAVTKLGDEIAAIGQNDWPTLLAVLGKIRSEAAGSARTTSTQATTALTVLKRQVRLQREELQMLWWIFAGHSRSLERSFSSFAPAQAALVAALDLGALTSVTTFGPIAAPAMLERVIATAKKPRGTTRVDLAGAVDGLAREDLSVLPLNSEELPPRLAPVSAALRSARLSGSGAWHAHFKETAELEVSIDFEPLDLASQLYRENLLGQLL